VMPKDILDGRVSESSIARVGEEHVLRLSQHRLRSGDIVYGRRGDIGRRALVTEREDGWLCGTGCLRISLGNSVLDPQFLFFYLGHPNVIAWIANQAVGATMPNLNTSILQSVPIRYPELEVQRRVASVLSDYDDLIENNTRRIGILEEMARRLYEEWFVHFRFPGHETTRLVESEIGRVPKGWRVVTVGEIATVVRGRSYRGTDVVDEGGVPFVNLKCIDRGGGFRKHGVKQYAGPFKDTQTVRAGDIVIAVTDMTQERRIVAHCGRVPRLKGNRGVISMDLVKVVSKPIVPAEFLYAFFRWSGFSGEVRHHANGTNVLHLHPDHILRYKFALPTDGLIREFASAAAAPFELMDVLGNQIETLRLTRDQLLPKLISGEIDVSTAPMPAEVSAA